jgi:alkylation response protein AidB-like acyl-CoA dehydrogenase
MAQGLSKMTAVSGLAVDCAAVDFDLSADQEALRDAATTLLERYADHDVLRARVGDGVVVGILPGAGTSEGGSGRIDAPSGYNAAVWAGMADQGWLALEVPDDQGGLGLGMIEVAVLCEQIGRHLVPAPFLPTVLALGALLEPSARSIESTAPWRGALAEGSMVGCVALVTDPARLKVSGPGQQVTLRGRVGPTVFAPSADLAVVATPDAVYAIDLAAAGRPAPLSAMDRTRELGDLVCSDTPALRIGGAAEADHLIDRAATALSAEMLGAADHVLAMTVAYAKDRVQFGKPIGSFQAVKHMLADALVDVEGMRSTAYYAAWCTAADDAERSLAASMAKSWCSDASRRVMAAGLQVHGGIGFTWEHDMHLFVKRAQLDQVSFGDAAFHRDRIAGILRARLTGGEPVAS